MPASQPHDLKRFIPRDPAVFVALAALLILVVPALVFGPWLPFIDLVSFVGMNTYPPQLSYGPLHYYTFQFTYEGHYVLSRLMSDLHVSAGAQVVAFYLAQVLVCFVVVWRSLDRLITNSWVRSVAIALGTLAFWDGVFLWGGPLAFSLSGTCVTIATFLTFREATEPGRNSSWAITLCLLFAMYCHPFAAPFALVVAGLRFVWVRRLRLHTAILAVVVVIYGYVILRDSPPSEANTSNQLSLLFGVQGTQMWMRIRGLFVQDRIFAQALYGSVPMADSILFVLYAIIRSIGFVMCPWIALRERNALWLRMLAALNSLIGLLYLFSWDLAGSPIPEWPQRILTVYAPFTFLGGVAAVVYVSRRWLNPADGLLRLKALAGCAGSVAVLTLMLAAEVPILRESRKLEANYLALRDGTLESGLKECYALVAGVDSIHPFFLRCVPFLLFSDPAIVSRHVLIATEWHFQPRHPSKVLETLIDVDRKRYLAEFSCPSNGDLRLEFKEQSDKYFPVLENTNVARWGNVRNLAADQFQKGMQLFADGIYNSSLEHFNTALYLDPKDADAWNDGGAALFRARRFSDAVNYFQHALEVDPKLHDARLNLAKALIHCGRGSEALTVLEEYTRSNPTNAEANQLLKELKTSAASGKP